ncbi:MAG: murein transglycosylase A [Alphaproteobacteria bacterium]
MKNILKFLWIPLLAFIIFKEFKSQPEPKIIEKEIIKEVPAKIEPTEEKFDISLLDSDFKAIPNWDKDTKLEDFRKAFENSCKVISSKKDKFLSDSYIKISTQEYKSICEKSKSAKNFKQFIVDNFTPYLIIENGNEFGKFTSYYESRINASHKKTDKYKYPVYGKPHDLVEINIKDFDETLPSKRFVGRVKEQKLVKYYTRKEIYEGKVNAPIIFWTDSYIDLFIMQIQGSAIAHFSDGKDMRIGYADNNGLDFKGIGSLLLKKGLIKPGQASMGGIKKWMHENPKLALDNMLENQRFIFHRLIDAEGPLGAQGVPLVAGRSVAVDRKFIPLGSVLWVDTTGPHHEKIQKLVVAQDIGSAIKGAIRGDYFWGSGNDEVLDMAGKMNAWGRLFILLPKSAEVVNGNKKTK